MNKNLDNLYYVSTSGTASNYASYFYKKDGLTDLIDEVYGASKKYLYDVVKKEMEKNKEEDRIKKDIKGFFV